MVCGGIVSGADLLKSDCSVNVYYQCGVVSILNLHSYSVAEFVVQHCVAHGLFV